MFGRLGDSESKAFWQPLARDRVRMLVSMVSLPVVRVSESPAIIPHGAVESWTLRGDHAGEPGVKPSVAAFVFLLFATRNPKPCPIVEVVDGGTEAARTAPGSDLPTYPDSGCSLMAGMWSRPLTLRVWRDGLVRVRLGGGASASRPPCCEPGFWSVTLRRAAMRRCS